MHTHKLEARRQTDLPGARRQVISPQAESLYIRQGNQCLVGSILINIDIKVNSMEKTKSQMNTIEHYNFRNEECKISILDIALYYVEEQDALVVW